jgi:hypothetical protein
MHESTFENLFSELKDVIPAGSLSMFTELPTMKTSYRVINNDGHINIENLFTTLNFFKFDGAINVEDPFRVIYFDGTLDVENTFSTLGIVL